MFPVFMIFLYDIKTAKLNKLYIVGYITLLITLLFYICYILFNPYMSLFTYLFYTYPTVYLITFYGLIGISFTYYLIQIKKWDFPQAFAISVLATALGTYFWEVPTIIYNFITVGFEIDIFLQLVAIMFFFFIYMKHGWRTDIKAKLTVVLGIVISIIFLYFRATLPPITSSSIILATYWNSPYFMTNRFISTLIVIYCVNKNKPMEKLK